MAFLDIAVHGAADAEAVLQHIEDRAVDIAPVVESIHKAFMAIEAARFDAEGPGWAPLAPSTLAQKQRKGLSERILEATGAMRASFVNPDARGHVFTVTANPDLTTVEMGSDYRSPNQTGKWAGTALAAFHQEGTGRMPARPVIADVDTRAVEWASLLSGWLTGTISARNL